MRTLAIGDIHGCFNALMTLAEFVPFRHEDRLVTLGDYVDRGPDSRLVLEWLIDRKEQGNLITLRGNHELMMLAAPKSDRHLEEWLSCGGDTALKSYSTFLRRGRLEDIPESHWKFVKATRKYFEIDTHFFVHANAYAEMPLEDQPDFMLFWEQFRDPPPHESGRIMVCGHTPQRSGQPKNLGHAVCIDTPVYDTGWLTCLDVKSSQCWQANQAGETRKFFLSDCD